MKWCIQLVYVVVAVTGSVLSQSLFQYQGRMRYDQVSVLRVYPDTPVAVEYLKSLESQLPGCEFWRLPARPGLSADLMVTSLAMREEAQHKLDPAGIRHEVMIDDLQELIDAEHQEMGKTAAAAAAAGNKALNLETYHSFSDIMDWLGDLEREFPALASVHSVGNTYEGREMKLIKIGTNPMAPVVWIDGGIHAREWLAPATVMWFINKLLSEYDTSAQIKELVDSVTWYVLPVHNPDGYEYSRSRERMWRKNRTPTPDFTIFGGACVGTDPNRNYDNNWGTTGISHNGCSDVYCGSRPASEPCVAAVTSYILSIPQQIQLYLTIHSYSQMWLLPYSYTYSRVPDYAELMAVAGRAVSALGSVYGTRYTYGQIPDILYTASGGSIDWAYDTMRIKFSYGVELRDTGRYGFIAPASEIRPSGEETWAAVVSLVNDVILNRLD